MLNQRKEPLLISSDKLYFSNKLIPFCLHFCHYFYHLRFMLAFILVFIISWLIILLSMCVSVAIKVYKHHFLSMCCSSWKDGDFNWNCYKNAFYLVFKINFKYNWWYPFLSFLFFIKCNLRFTPNLHTPIQHENTYST